MHRTNLGGVVCAAGAILALAVSLSAGDGARRAPSSPQQPSYDGLTPEKVKAPDFPKPGAQVSGTTWIDSPPLTMADLRGKVVLVDFWEYTCINCVRTLGQNKTWYARYHKYGFEIVGVHDPEFDIGYKVDNVRAAVKRFGLPYPIVTDDFYTIWKSYRNNAWPHRYLIDANGNIRYQRAGEGADREFEEAIRYLLEQAHPGLKFPASYNLPPVRDDMAPGCGGSTTEEMFVGPTYGKGSVVNPNPYHPGKSETYEMPASVGDGGVGLSGEWETNPNGMIFTGKEQTPDGKAARLRMRYRAAELYAVINVSRGKPERVYILQDGKYLDKDNKGVDVQIDSQGRSYLEIDSPRMYYLVSNLVMSGHEVDLIPTGPGITMDSFTFGNDCQRSFPHL